jgi:hypothetical protein
VELTSGEFRIASDLYAHTLLGIIRVTTLLSQYYKTLHDRTVPAGRDSSHETDSMTQP